MQTIEERLLYLKESYLGANKLLAIKASNLPLGSPLARSYYKKLLENRERYTDAFHSFFLPSAGVSEGLNLERLQNNRESIEKLFKTGFPVFRKLGCKAILVREASVDFPCFFQDVLWLPEYPVKTEELTMLILKVLTPNPEIYYKFIHAADLLSADDVREAQQWK